MPQDRMVQVADRRPSHVAFRSTALVAVMSILFGVLLVACSPQARSTGVMADEPPPAGDSSNVSNQSVLLLDRVLLGRLMSASTADRSQVHQLFTFARLIVVSGETFTEVNLAGSSPSGITLLLDRRCAAKCTVRVDRLLEAVLDGSLRATAAVFPPPLEGFTSWPTLAFLDPSSGVRWRVAFDPDELSLAVVEYFGPLPPSF